VITNVGRAVQLIDEGLIREVLEKARRSNRRRMNHNFHNGPEDNPHRFLNILVEGSYVAPHRHLNPPKAESFIVLDGFVLVFCFDDVGNICGRYLLGNRRHPQEVPLAFSNLRVARGIDLPSGVWHTIAAVTPYAVCFEVKPGPWDPATDKEFAQWAPPENDSNAAEYLDTLLRQGRRP
jgi:cupin fold WbuC family metalloprotein